MSQIDMFELLVEPTLNEQEGESVSFEINDLVKVKKIQEDDIDQLDPEDYYYLKDFMNKKGKISEVIYNSKDGIYSYKVEFDREVIGYFYEGDLVLL